MNPELIFLLIAIVFLFLGIKTKRSTFIAYGKKVEGTIIGNKHSRASGGSGVYYPIVLFVTENNISISQELSSGHYPAKKVGKKIRLIYDPNNPQKVEIDSRFLLEILPLILIVMGTGWLIISVLLFLDVPIF